MTTFNFFNLFIELLTILALLSAVSVITSTNPVLAIIFLIIVFINAAIYLILNGLGFIGISYIIVYIGAITVFFLFVIMMISTEIIDTVAVGAEFGIILPLVYSLSVLFIYLFILFVPSFLFGDNNWTALKSEYYIENDDVVEVYSNILADAAAFNIKNFTSEMLFLINIYLFSNNIINSEVILSNADAATNLLTNYITIISNNLYFNSPDSFLVPVLQIQILSEAVYGFVAFLLILTSFLLLLAMICPIILTKK